MPMPIDEERMAPPATDEEPPELDDIGSNVTELEDGSAIVHDEEDKPNGSTDFLENLAEVLDPSDLSHMSVDLLDLIEKDQEARKRRDEQYAEGIKRTGLGNEAPGGADFEGASKAVHPILAEACVDFAARAMKELFPARGPVRTEIIGPSTPERLDRAERKKTYLNWQLSGRGKRTIKEYRSELEQLLTQLPLGGSQYLKIWYDERACRQRAEFIPIDDMFVPFSASDFYNSPRKTHRQRITRTEFEGRIASGLYRDVRTSAPADATEDESESSKASRKIEGKDDDLSYNEDGLRIIYEIYVQYEIADPLVKDGAAPYIITIDDSSGEVLAIYRDWEQDDPTLTELDWMVDFSFIPWRGAQAIGLPHLIGSLAGALTGALRALLDSAHINNAATMLKLKGNRMSGQATSIDVTQVAEIEGPAGCDDIRKIAMPMPFNPPSMVLYQLLQWITDQARGVVGTAEETIQDANSNMPVGTTLALIEQGSITYSAIHSRLHAAQAKALEIIHRINGIYLDEQEEVKELGGLIVRRADFQGPMDIIPVSDPNIFSDAQRYAQNQAALQLAADQRVQYNLVALHRRMLTLLNIPDIDEVLPPPPTPQNLNAVGENIGACSGQQLMALPPQNHLAHLHTHLDFATSPTFGGGPLLGPKVIPVLLDHISQHLAFYYSSIIQQAAEKAANAAFPALQQSLPTTQLDANLALTGEHVLPEMEKELAPVMQKLQQAMQLAQQYAPKPQPDPASAAAIQIADMTNKSKESLKGQELQQKDQAQQRDLAQRREAENNRLMTELKKEVMTIQGELQALDKEGQNQAMIEEMRLRHQHVTDLINHLQGDSSGI